MIDEGGFVNPGNQAPILLSLFVEFWWEWDDNFDEFIVGTSTLELSPLEIFEGVLHLFCW